MVRSVISKISIFLFENLDFMVFDATWPNCAFDISLCRDREIFLNYIFLWFLPYFGGKIPDNLDICTRKNIFSEKSLCHDIKHYVFDIYAKYEL